MSDKDTSGPAFPVQLKGLPDNAYYPGMTLRDYFAGQALSGVITMLEEARPNKGGTWDQMTAEKCFLIADAMLEARK